jgi:hypothetical protein
VAARSDCRGGARALHLDEPLVKVCLTLLDRSEVVLNGVVFDREAVTGTTRDGDRTIRRATIVRQRLLVDEHGRPVRHRR